MNKYQTPSTVKKNSRLSEQFVRSVFEDVVAGLREFQRTSIRKAAAEFAEEIMRREAPVFHSPDQLHRMIAEFFQRLLDFRQRGIAAMRWLERYVLHELMHGNPMSPRIIRGDKASPRSRAEWFFNGHRQGGAGEQIEATISD